MCFFSALRAEVPSTSPSRWVNQARVGPLLSPVCQFSAEVTARGRNLCPPLPLQGEWEMVSTALPHPAPTPALAALGSAGAFSVLRLLVSQPKETAILLTSPQTWTMHLSWRRAPTRMETIRRRWRRRCLRLVSVTVAGGPGCAILLDSEATRRRSHVRRQRSSIKGPPPPQPIEMCL